MNSIRVYDRQDRIIFIKNSHLYFIYKYEKGKEIVCTLSAQGAKAKYQSVFDYKEKSDEYVLSFSISANHLEYQIINNNNSELKEVETGRIPIDKKKKEWFKKTITNNDGETIGIENFDGSRSVIYKLNNEFINKLIK